MYQTQMLIESAIFDATMYAYFCSVKETSQLLIFCKDKMLVSRNNTFVDDTLPAQLRERERK
jgi:hypothetical protein